MDRSLSVDCWPALAPSSYGWKHKMNPGEGEGEGRRLLPYMSKHIQRHVVQDTTGHNEGAHVHVPGLR